MEMLPTGIFFTEHSAVFTLVVGGVVAASSSIGCLGEVYDRSAGSLCLCD